jgi:hypothetical protein
MQQMGGCCKFGFTCRKWILPVSARSFERGAKVSKTLINSNFWKGKIRFSRWATLG